MLCCAFLSFKGFQRCLFWHPLFWFPKDWLVKSCLMQSTSGKKRSPLRVPKNLYNELLKSRPEAEILQYSMGVLKSLVSSTYFLNLRLHGGCLQLDLSRQCKFCVLWSRVYYFKACGQVPPTHRVVWPRYFLVRVKWCIFEVDKGKRKREGKEEERGEGERQWKDSMNSRR